MNWTEIVPGVLPWKIGMVPMRLPSKTSCWRSWGMVRDWLFDGLVVGWVGLSKMRWLRPCTIIHMYCWRCRWRVVKQSEMTVGGSPLLKGCAYMITEPG